MKKAFFTFQRRNSNVPIKLVYVLLSGQGEEVTNTPPQKKRALMEEHSKDFYPSTPPRNFVHSISNSRIIEDINSFSSGQDGIIHNLRSRQSPSYQKPVHTIKNEPITQPYSGALEGCCITALADPENQRIIRKLCKVMGGCYIIDFSDITQILVVDHSRDEKLFAQARHYKVSIVSLAWLLTCQEENRKVSVEDYLVH